MSLTYLSTDSFTYKRDKDGHLIVRGIASDDTLDLDKQSCDPDWLKSAIPQWARIGNVREMHGSSAVGKALSIAQEGKGWVVEAKIVDKAAAEKIEEGVYTGFSIGIKNAVVDKSATAATKAPNGIIKGGEIVEISVVDRPANPSSVLEVVKTVNGEAVFSDIVKNDQELTISELPYTDTPVNEGNLPCQVCNGLGKTSDLENPKECEWCKGTGVDPQPSTDGPYPTTGRPDPNANYNPGNKSVEGDVEKKDYSDKERADLADKGQALPDGSYPIKNVADLKKAIQDFGRAKDPAKVKAHIKARAKALGRADLIPDEWEKAVDAEILKWAESLNKGAESGQWLHDPKDLAAIRSGLVELLKAELDEVASGDDEEYCDLDQLLCALNLFLAWWKGEAEEGETTAPFPSNESDDVMAFTGLGVSADLIKSATADDASDDAKEELRSEIVKSLGLESVFDLKAKLADAEETIKGLTGRLDTVEQMAAPGGPAKTGTPKGSTNTNPQIVAKMTQVDKFLRLAETVTDPIEARGFRADAQRLLNEVQAASN